MRAASKCMSGAAAAAAARCARASSSALTLGGAAARHRPLSSEGAFHGRLDRALAASGRAESSPALTNKCQIIFTIGDQPGALQAVLALFHTHRVNMTRIESRPSKGPMSSTYDFVVDFDGKVRAAAGVLTGVARVPCRATTRRCRPRPSPSPARARSRRRPATPTTPRSPGNPTWTRCWPPRARRAPPCP